MRITLILLLFSSLAFSQIKYVNLAGGGDGSSTASPMTLDEARTTCNPGDIFYIYPDNYGGQTSNKTYRFERGGTQSQPIQWIGVDASWQPIVNPNTYAYYDKDQLDALSTFDMPYFEGFRYETWDKASNTVAGVGTANDFTGTGTAIDLRSQYHIVENIVIKGYAIGIQALWPNNTIRNVMTMYQGDFDVENSYDKCYVDNGGQNGVSPPECTGIGQFDNYNGIGINSYGSNITVEHCLAYNAGAEGIRLRGDNSNHTNNYVASDSDINGTDYYYQISYQDGSTVENSYVWRSPNNRHLGHGISLKYDITNTTIRNVTVENTNFELQNIENNNNLIIDSFSINGYVSYNNGANNSTLQNHTFTGSDSSGILFQNWSEGADEAGYDITIKNCKFLDGKTFVNFAGFSTSYDVGPRKIDFINCTVDGIDNLFTQERANTNINFINTSISNVTNFMRDPIYNTRCFPIDVEFINCNFFGNGFTTPTTGSFDFNPCSNISGQSTVIATNTSTGNPLFDVNFVPQSGSALIDAGVVNAAVTTDFTGDPVPFGSSPDIGAEESQGGSADVTAPLVVSTSVINTTETTFRVGWTLDEGSKGRIKYGTSTGVYTEFTNQENNFLSYHEQTVGGNNAPFLTPGTTYYYVMEVEDAAGNTGDSIEYSHTTVGEGGNPVIQPVVDMRALNLKTKKL